MQRLPFALLGGSLLLASCANLEDGDTFYSRHHGVAAPSPQSGGGSSPADEGPGTAGFRFTDAVDQEGATPAAVDPSIGSVWGYLAGRYDRDGDGRVSAIEYDRDPAQFQSWDRDGDGVLLEADFESLSLPGEGGAPQGPEMADDLALQEGAEAPDFILGTADGSATYKLSGFRGSKPVALIFGSYTSPHLRAAAPRLRTLHEEHGDSVQFLLVYTREAHAIDSASPRSGAGHPIVEDPRTLAERSALAMICLEQLALEAIPVVVDDLDDSVSQAFGAAPERLYLVGRDGTILHRTDPGPSGFELDGFGAACEAALGGTGR